MTTATLIPLHLRADLTATLARLRIACTVEDDTEIKAAERRLNWLCDQLPRQENP